MRHSKRGHKQPHRNYSRKMHLKARALDVPFFLFRKGRGWIRMPGGGGKKRARPV
jgi:hypothetical protein